MAPVKPMLGDVELEKVQTIEVDGDQVLVQHGVPALEGDFLQGLGRRATQVSLTGVLTGPEVGEGLKSLRDKFRAAEPVPFVADITTATRVDQVLIEEMGVRELAGKPERFEYALTLREFIAPPVVVAEEPPEPDVPEPPDDDIDQDVGTLIVEVIVEGRPGFDFSTVTVTAEGTQADDTVLSRTLTNRTDNIWTEEDFPVGQYTVEAVVTEPEAMSGSAPARVQAGQTTQVTITLRPGAIIAKAFIVHLWFDKAFIEPCMRLVMQQVAEYAQAHPDEKVVIVGHTDKVGDDPPVPPLYNQSLSERRGRSAFAYLTYGLDSTAATAEWDQLRRARTPGVRRSINDTWGVREYQHILQDLSYYSGNIDEIHGPMTDAAVRAFQQDNGLAVDGIVGDDTWPALIEAYLSQDALAVPESQFLPNCGGEILKWLGCGEQEPVKNTQDAWRPNRRTELLFVKADALPCEVPEPDTFGLPAPGAVGSDWCLGPGNPNQRCCFITREAEEEGKWLVQPAEPGTITVQGSIKFEDGTPAANVEYVLIAPDGEFMNGERPKRPDRGRPIPGRTAADGAFAYPDKPKGIGVYTLEVEGPYVARLAGEPPEAAKGNVVCKRLDGTSDFEIVVSPAETGDPRRKLRAIIYDRFGEVRKHTEVDVRFNDGTVATATTDDQGEFIIEMSAPHEFAKIHYGVSDDDPTDVVFYADFFIDVKGTDTEEGVRRRLHNLGYFIDDDLSDALIAFQATHGLDTTGEADQETLDKLVAVYDGDEPLVPEFDILEDPGRPDDLVEEGPPV